MERFRRFFLDMTGFAALTLFTVGLVLIGGAGVRAAEVTAEKDAPALERQIQARLQSDPELRNNKIDVHVAGGVVSLKGTVDSDQEKSRAARLAAVPTVATVDNQLKVESAGVKEVVSDTAITTQIKGQLAANTGLRKGDIAVTTNNGVVTLRGTVPSEDLRRLAGDIARNTGGVNRVENEIKVTTGLPMH
jgi:osmotically-inducible protein OsmY